MTQTTLAMTREHHAEGEGGLTKNDRFSSVLVVLVALISVGLGLVLRQRTLSQTWLYSNTQAGIDATYPAGWLTDHDGNYIVRISDPRAQPYKTQYVIVIVPVAGGTSIRNVLDSLTLQRSVDLSAYRVFNVEEVNARGLTYTRMEFAFVHTDANPFVERLPVVVQGQDIVILDGDRAIIVSFMSDRESYAENLRSFEAFVAALRY